MDMVEYYSRHKVNIKGAEHTYLEIPVFRDRWKIPARWLQQGTE